MNYINFALRTAGQKLREVAGKDVVYLHGEQSITITGAIGTTPKPGVVERYGFRTGSVDRQFMIETEQLVVKREKFLPQVGDKIVDGVHEYALLQAGNKQTYQPMEPSEGMIRVFAQRIK